MTEIRSYCKRNLENLRNNSPLVHNITNYVVMNFSANVLLATGASPIMAHAPEEVEEMATICGALVINIGTLSQPWIDSMIIAGKKAKELGKPIVLDPVGVGASKLRTETAKKIIAEVGPTVIRGNASEIIALADATSTTKGVDSTHDVSEATEIAERMASELGCVVVVTGKVDYVTDGEASYKIANGHSLLTAVTGTGCSATAVTGAFLASGDDVLSSSVAALAFFGMAGERAAKKESQPGSFAVALVDALHEISPEDLQEHAAISKVK